MKTRKTQIFLLIIALFFPAIVLAQTADEIIAKHLAAHGDLKKWKQIESMKITGKFTAFSEQKDFFCIKTKSGVYYSELFLGKNAVIEAFNGKTGWTIDPWQDILYARRLNSAEENVFQQKALFFTPFFDYKEKGGKVEYTGKENIDGEDVYVLKLTKANGKVETWYLNSNTYLEFKCESEWVDFATPVPAQTFFDDFRTVNGLVIPFFIERTFWQRDRILQIENIEFNIKLDEKLLVMPRKEQMNKLEFMEGEWDVSLEVFTRRGTWYQIGKTTSSFEFASKNLLQENINYENYFPYFKRVEYTYNDAGKKYRICVFEDLSSTFEIFEGNFTDSCFTTDNCDISYTAEQAENKSCTQLSICNIEKGSFILEIKSSNDGGKNWNPREKYTYTRKIK